MKEISENENKVYYKPQINFLPSNLDLDDWLSQQKLYGFKNFSKDSCAKLLSNIYTVPVYNKKTRDKLENTESPFYNLSSKILYAQDKEYNKYVDLFISSGIWESDYTYETGKKSLGYRYSNTYNDKPCKKYLNYKFGNHFDDSQSVSKSLAQGEENSITVNKLIDFLGSVSLDYKASMNHLSSDFSKNGLNINKYNCTYCSLEKIHNREYYAMQDDYGRLHTNITNLKKEYRSYLTADGERLASIDLKNSQPFFSVSLLKSSFWKKNSNEEKLSINNLKPLILENINNLDSIIMFTKSVEGNVDIERYIDLVVNGLFYDFFLQKLVEAGLGYETRKEAKEVIFQIFFSPDLYLKKSRAALIFENLFPSVYKFFALVKMKSHNNLALLLQGVESYVFIEEIARNFIGKSPKSPVLTIHDSFLVPLKKMDTLKFDVKQCIIEKTGYCPSLEIEVLTPVSVPK